MRRTERVLQKLWKHKHAHIAELKFKKTKSAKLDRVKGQLYFVVPGSKCTIDNLNVARECTQIIKKLLRKMVWSNPTLEGINAIKNALIQHIYTEQPFAGIIVTNIKLEFPDQEGPAMRWDKLHRMYLGVAELVAGTGQRGQESIDLHYRNMKVFASVLTQFRNAFRRVPKIRCAHAQFGYVAIE